MKQIKSLMVILFLALGVVSIPPVTLAQEETVCQQDVIVQADDWLSKIADKFYSDVLAYARIVEATNAKAGVDGSYAQINNPDVIEIGWKLCVPAAADTTVGQPVSSAKTYVLVHGAYQDKSAWQEVVPRLETLGHRAIAIDLPGHGEDKTSIADRTLQLYRDKVIEVINAQSEPVILVGHSFGGITISEVAEAIPDKIDTLVYVAAYLPQNGESLLSLAEQDTGTAFNEDNFILAEDFSYATVLEADIIKIFCEDCSDMYKQYSIENHQPEATLPVSTSVSVTLENFGRVPKVYIETLQDNAVSNQLQRLMLERTPVDKILTLDSSHSPFFSMPAALVAHLTNLD